MLQKKFWITLLLLNSFFSNSAWASQGVLIIGDSHSYGPFGEVLDSYYRKHGFEVSSYASCGSSPSNWMNNNQNFKTTNCGYWSKDPQNKETRVKSHKIPSMTDLIAKTKPKITVISLGTNILASTSNIKHELKYVEQMIAKIKEAGSDCIWIGPPDLHKNPFKANLELGVSSIKATVEKYGCHFLDSRNYTKYPKGNSDGIHYGANDSKNWGTAVTSKLMSLSKDTSTSSNEMKNLEANKKTTGAQ